MRRFFFALLILSFGTIAFGEDLHSEEGCELEVTLRENGCDKAKLQAYNEAIRHDFSFIKSESQLQWFIREGLLVELKSQGNLVVLPMDIGRPYVRPEVRDWALTQSQNLFANCGEKLKVSSAVRFTSVRERLNNSPRETVHPTGMAVDIWAPSKKCRDDFDDELLSLEANGLVQANFERYTKPQHYHVSVFPEQYAANVDLHERVDEAEYRVRSGDTLWTIANRFGTTITTLVASNELDSPDFLKIGQEITLR